MSEFYTVLFKSRNKDNTNIQHFNQRIQTFLSDAPIETLNNQFDAFVEAGRHNELCRFYISVNPRNIVKANNKLIHYLIDHPNLRPDDLHNKLVSFASQADCAVTHKWLFDYDQASLDENIVQELKDIFKDDILIKPTVSGHAIVVPNGFDSRDFLSDRDFMTLHRDGMLLENWAIK